MDAASPTAPKPEHVSSAAGLQENGTLFYGYRLGRTSHLQPDTASDPLDKGGMQMDVVVGQLPLLLAAGTGSL
jgi:hypothetical protein